MKFSVSICLIPLFFLLSCKPHASGVWINENIDPSLTAEITALNVKVMQALSTNDIKLLNDIMSAQLRASNYENITHLIEQTSKVLQLKNEYRTLDKFYLKNSKTGIGNTVKPEEGADNEYVIRFKALNKEMFISVLVAENESDEFLITSIYGKYPEGWKLNILYAGQYTIKGRNPVSFYKQAQQDYKKGHLADAICNLYLSSTILKPAGQVFQYEKEKEINLFQEEVMTAIKQSYQFPLTLSAVQTNPQVFNIYPQITQEGIYPMVEYITTVELTDTTSLKIENDQIHEQVGKVFPGLDQDRDFLIYKAYNQLPAPAKKVPTYGFLKEIKR